ncbi:MAG: hypothetical protein P8O04_00930 [Flavobacteriaceae bacterium]|nr:hypothetical protein [Flavobacteriaceae bacterium]
MIRLKKTLWIGGIFLLGWLLFWFQNNRTIATTDACLCTELLASPSITKNKAKIKAVRDCEWLFEDFEKAHQKCMESVPFETPKTNTNPSKTT